MAIHAAGELRLPRDARPASLSTWARATANAAGHIGVDPSASLLQTDCLDDRRAFILGDAARTCRT